MKRKALLTVAALCAASAFTLQAAVYSVNVVGYVNKTIAAGDFALLANPLNQPTNTIGLILPDVPVNTVVYKYVGGGFSQITKRLIGGQPRWTGGTADATTLNPGEAFFIKNAGAEPMTITFVGEVIQGTGLTIPLAEGYNMVGSLVPVDGGITTVHGLNPTVNDQVLKYVAGGYSQFTYRLVGGSGRWTASEPSIGVGEGFWYKATAAGNWTRDFTVPE